MEGLDNYIIRDSTVTLIDQASDTKDSICDSVRFDYSNFGSETCLNYTGVVKKISNSKINLFPNPTNGTFTLDLGIQHEKVFVILRNTMGQIILKRKLKNITVFDLEIEGNNGLYSLEVRTHGDRWAVIRILKE